MGNRPHHNAYDDAQNKDELSFVSHTHFSTKVLLIYDQITVSVLCIITISVYGVFTGYGLHCGLIRQTDTSRISFEWCACESIDDVRFNLHF